MEQCRVRLMRKSPSEAIVLCRYLSYEGWYVERQGMYVVVRDTNDPDSSDMLFKLSVDLHKYDERQTSGE